MARIQSTTPALKPDRSKRAVTPAKRPGSATTAASKSAKPPAAKTARKHSASPKDVSIKLERGRFSMPVAEFRQIAALKNRALHLGRPAKKNELLRIGLLLVSALSDETLLIALDQLAPTRPAKPKKPKPAQRADS